MNFLIIYSNHHKGNFNWQLLESLRQNLAEEGHTIEVRDLYKMDFDPVLRTQDFEQISSGSPPEDIVREQKYVRESDVLVFIYPVWWGGMPAVVKGYIDKVFSWGFAYMSNSNGVYPLLTGKKAFVLSTLGQSREEYEKGMFQAMSKVNEEGVFGFCGIQVLEQLYFPSIHQVDNQQKEDYIEQAVFTLKSMAAIPK